MAFTVRLLLLVALSLVAATPAHAFWPPAAGHHGTAGHLHAGHPAGNAAHQHDETDLCCASLAMQCGSAALTADGRWSLAEPLFVDVARVRDAQAFSEAPLPEFEPPPPRI